MPDDPLTTCTHCGSLIRVHAPEHDGATGSYVPVDVEQLQAENDRLRNLLRDVSAPHVLAEPARAFLAKRLARLLTDAPPLTAEDEEWLAGLKEAGR